MTLLHCPILADVNGEDDVMVRHSEGVKKGGREGGRVGGLGERVRKEKGKRMEKQ